MYNLDVYIAWFRKNIYRNTSIERFVKFNSTLVSKTDSNHAEKIALFELHVSMTTYLLYSFICQFKRKSNIKLIGYRPIRNRRKMENFAFFIFSKFNLDNGVFRPFRILRSMKICKFIQPRNMGKYKSLATQVLNQINKDDKENLLNLELNGIRIGDILYDWHLREHSLDTVDFNSSDFENDFQIFVCSFYWWCDYFEGNRVDSVFVSHTVYQQAITVRIGLYFGVDVFLVGNDRLYHLNNDKKWSDIEFLDYEPNSAEQFGYQVDLNRAKLELKKLRSGNGTTAAHAYASGYIGEEVKNIIKDEKAINILIACHCFSDAPHANGDMLFPDFREWLNFIGKLSIKTSYHFYAKAHPYFWESDKLHYKDFLDKNPNIIEVSSSFSNLELFRQGINVVLTIHGTIAFEAAYEGILVINASLNSPHVNYNFSLSPSSITEFRDIILNLPNIIPSWKVNTEEVEHFFDLHHLRRNRNILFLENTKVLYNDIGGYDQQFTNPKVFDIWLNNFSEFESEMLAKRIENFLMSDSYFLHELE